MVGGRVHSTAKWAGSRPPSACHTTRSKAHSNLQQSSKAKAKLVTRRKERLAPVVAHTCAHGAVCSVSTRPKKVATGGLWNSVGIEITVVQWTE